MDVPAPEHSAEVADHNPPLSVTEACVSYHINLRGRHLLTKYLEAYRNTLYGQRSAGTIFTLSLCLALDQQYLPERSFYPSLVIFAAEAQGTLTGVPCTAGQGVLCWLSPTGL